MEVNFTQEQEARLAEIAMSVGKNAQVLVKEAALRLLEGDAGSLQGPIESVVAEMHALRARVKPDPEGWTTRDYVLYGRR
jgi:hypothetical protein